MHEEKDKKRTEQEPVQQVSFIFSEASQIV
jgi:hypothetical protein